MRRTTPWVATILSSLALSTCGAQYHHGPRPCCSSSRQNFTSLMTSTGLNSPMGTFYPMNSSPNATLSTAQYRSQLAQQQYLFAQQQRYLQALAQQQRNLESQLSGLRSADPPDASPGEEDSPTNLRRERLRRQNAEKAFQVAEQAKMNGRLSTAQKNYSRVVRIFGDTDALGRRAADALEELAQNRRDSRVGERRLVSETR